jgi:hypothetical protein
MKKIFLFSLIILSGTFLYSQSDTSNYKGTIKIIKKGNVYAVMYDEVNFRLVGKDQYGNILDSCVVQFRIKTTIKGIAYDELTTGNALSKKMQYQLSRLDGGTTLFFSEIIVTDKSGNKTKWNDFKVKTGYKLEREY